MRKRSQAVRGLVAATGVALVAPLLVGSVTAAPASQPSTKQSDGRRAGSDVLAHNFSESAARTRATNRYWTPKRMREATPPRVQISPQELKRRVAKRAYEPVKPGGVGKPTTSAPAAARLGGKRSKRIRVGKMFYKFGRQNRVCSGAVVNTKKKNLVFTAAHCLWDKKKGWAKRVRFAPGYNKRGARFGLWRAKRAVIPRKFKKFRGRKESLWHDVAVMKVGRKGGPRIAKKVGGYGVQWGRKNRRKMTAVGYPSFRRPGKVQRACKGRTRKSRKYSWRGHKILTMKCRAVTAGSSGGPWLRRGYINGQNAGVNSFKKPRRIFTPYFDGTVKRLFKKI